MKVNEKLSLEEIQAFLEASEEVGFKGRNREEVYEWINQALRGQRYQELKRSGRGVVRRYVEKMTGLSRAQVTRLIALYASGEEVKARAYRRHGFTQRYTREDVELLAAVDEAHDCLSGPATLQKHVGGARAPHYSRRLPNTESAPVRVGLSFRRRLTTQRLSLCMRGQAGSATLIFALYQMAL